MENYQNDNRTESSTTDDWQEREWRKGPNATSEVGARPHKSYKDSSPEEVKAAVKEQVSKGVAAAAGAVEGLADEMENDHLPETAGRAIGLVGETTRTIAKTTVEEARKTKEAIQGSVSGSKSLDSKNLDKMDKDSNVLGSSSYNVDRKDSFGSGLDEDIDDDLDQPKPGF